MPKRHKWHATYRAVRFLFAAMIAMSATLAPAVLHADEDTIRINDVFDLPDWLNVRLATVLRYERLDGQFRPGLLEVDQTLSVRNLFLVEAKLRHNITIGAELQDSRLYIDDESTPLSTGLVNTAEMLQAYMNVDLNNLIAEGDVAQIRVGRITHDQGRRRFFARNRFRNTINAFTGIMFNWQSPDAKHLVETFYTLPVQRQPRDFNALLTNDVQFDNESFAQQFWGVFYSTRALPLGLTGDFFVYGLHEKDTPGRRTRNRQIFTPGFSIYHLSKPGEWFVDTEGALNIGTSRSSASPLNTTDLDHFAYYFHAEFGYHFDAPLKPRLLLQYDIASGDADPNDGNFGRFDTLFGPRRADFGHTNIYAAFARGNIQTFAAAVHGKPSKKTHFRMRYQAGFLEEARDVWLSVGVVDPTGQSGTFLGHQIETRAHWDVLPGNLRLGMGSAFLFSGEFADTAPNSNGFGNTYYFYTDLSLTF